jgi:sugar/nucleoside kinase (ribokinase family)
MNGIRASIMNSRGRCRHVIEFVAVGHLAVDRLEGAIRLGGAAAYSALAANRLGLSVAVISAVGRDFDLFHPLEGIEVHYHRCSSSTTFENTYTNDDRRQRLLSRAHTLREEDLKVLDSRLAEDAIVLYCPIANEVQMPLKRLVSKGICGVAPQGYFRRWDSGGTVYAAPWQNARDRLQSTDCLILSQDDPPQLEVFMQEAVGSVPIVAVTKGRKGVQVYSDQDTYHVPALIREAVDPTGAGDVFAAAFLVALREGRPVFDAARFGCSAASFSVEKPGILGIPPSREAVGARITP